MELKCRNTNILAPQVYRLIQNKGFEDTSRNGPVLRFMEPVSICLSHPYERVHFSAARDCNPFFHLMEAMAMLVPVNSVRLMAHFAKHMATFSDNGHDYNAFYGTRARSSFGFDQLDRVITELQAKPDSRQCVVALWDPMDLQRTTKDKACNLSMIFEIKASQLCMTTLNRSNDAILGGVSGANIVHLSYFQEYVACSLDLPMGDWWHVSNNLHVYTDHPKWEGLKLYGNSDDDRYDSIEEPWKLFTLPEDKKLFDEELQQFMHRALQTLGFTTTPMIDETTYGSVFINNVIVPVFNSWQCHKNKDLSGALEWGGQIGSMDWRIACTEWLQRRYLPEPASTDATSN